MSRGRRFHDLSQLLALYIDYFMTDLFPFRNFKMVARFSIFTLSILHVCCLNCAGPLFFSDPLSAASSYKEHGLSEVLQHGAIFVHKIRSFGCSHGAT